MAHSEHSHDSHSAHHDEHEVVSHEAANHNNSNHGTEHETDGISSQVSERVIEALGIGDEKHPKLLGPVSLAAQVTRDIGSILDVGVLQYFERIGEAVSTSHTNVLNAGSFGKFFGESSKGIMRVSDALFLGIARSIQGIYSKSKNLITHLSAGTLDWFGDSGIMIGNGVKKIWNLPSTLYNKFSPKTSDNDLVHAHH